MDAHFDRVFDVTERTAEPPGGAGSKRRREPTEKAVASRQSRDADELTDEQLAELVAAAETVEVPTLDVNGVKSLLLSVEKSISRNSLARTKYAGEPARFMDTEVDLDGQLKALRVLAAAPDLYHVLVSSATLHSLLELLSHENSDIACDVVSLLAELTDDDAVAGHEQSAVALIGAVAEASGIELLVQNMGRLEAGSSEGNDDDAQGIYSSLSLIENILELVPDLAPAFCDTAKTQVSLLALLLKRIRYVNPVTKLNRRLFHRSPPQHP